MEKPKNTQSDDADDPLAAARGIVNGVIFSVCIWGIILSAGMLIWGGWTI